MTRNYIKDEIFICFKSIFFNYGQHTVLLVQMYNIVIREIFILTVDVICVLQSNSIIHGTLSFKN